MLNRTEAPAFKQIEDIQFIKAQKHVLTNQIPVFVVNAGDQDLVRIEFIFSNSAWDINRPIMPSVTNSMLTEGTHSLSSAQIAAKIDYYGAFFQAEYGYDQSSLTLYALNKHIANTLPIIKEMLTGSIFPDKELETLLRNAKQRLKVGLEKNDVLARRSFLNALFGDSIYGYNNTLEDYDNVKKDHLINYYSKVYHPKNCTIVMSGKISQEQVSLINQLFGNWEGATQNHQFEVNFSSSSDKLHYTERKDALQSAIRIGMPSINRTHPDFIGLQILNTVLGGYFGSRLMANIREDKGYTYGIHSYLQNYMHAGAWMVSTDAGKDVCKATIEEVYKEMKKLREELVGEEELKLVKNYMFGALLGDLDGPFQIISRWKTYLLNDLTEDYFYNTIKVVRSVRPEELQALANTYLKEEDFYELVVY